MIKQVTKDEFVSTKAVSYSRLSKLAISPQSYLSGLEDDPESSALTIGSAVDVLLTEGDTEFRKQFSVMSVDAPSSDMMRTYAEVYYQTNSKQQAYEASGFKISPEAVYKKFMESGKQYYDALIRASGKKVIDIKDYNTAHALVNQILRNPYVSEYFNRNRRRSNIEILYQVPIIWHAHYTSHITGEAESTKIKSLLDAIQIDHNSKTVRPIELKTGAEGFFRSYWRYKRYLQGAMYTDAVIYALDSDYVVEPVRFVYADTNLVEHPTIYRMTETDLVVARNGVNHMSLRGHILNSTKIKGYNQLLAELDWHKKNDKWEYNYDVYQNNGEVDINSFIVKL